MKLGQHWRDLAPYFHRFDNLIGVLLVLGAAVFIYARLRGRGQAPVRGGASSQGR
jgi:hypothetical protein